MSQETLTHLNAYTLIGYTEKRGTAWHYRAEEQGDEPNHYTGAIPIGDLRRRLFNWAPIEGEITATALLDDGVLTTVDKTRKAIMRSDTGAVLGIFKKGYRAHDYNEWLVTNVEAILDADLAVGSAGLLRGGAVAWVQVEMEDTLDTPQGVEYRPFLTAATSLDGTLATTYKTGAQVVVCDNTLSAAMNGKGSAYKVRHSTNSLNRILEVRDALQIVHTVADDFSAKVRALCDQGVTDAEWGRFVAAHTGWTPELTGRAKTMTEGRVDELNHLYFHDNRVNPWRGTAYGALSAVNTWAHHVQTVRGNTRAARNMERAVMGEVDNLDRLVLAQLDKVLGTMRTTARAAQ